jgi:hypothetical protein
MARKDGREKQQRFFDGILLAENLYKDSRNRDGYWRYRRPDRTFKTFPAGDVHLANKIAEKNNALRDQIPKKNELSIKGALAAHVDDYISDQELKSPSLLEKDSWRNRKYSLRQFCRQIVRPLVQLERKEIMHWWDVLSAHQQKARHAEFRRFFNYLMGRELLPKMQYNPFTLADDKPRFYESATPKRASVRFDMDGFWKIYHCAGDLGFEALQIAMGISLTTFMRETDILTLKLSDDLEDDLLRKVIGKSLSQVGEAKAERLQWNMKDYVLLRNLINRARLLAIKNYACPYVISHTGQTKKVGKTKDHICQVTPRSLITMMKKSRDLAGYAGMENPPTFHTVRSLANSLAKNAQESKEAIQKNNAHKSVDTQLIYQEGHNLPFDDAPIQFTADQIGGDFK